MSPIWVGFRATLAGSSRCRVRSESELSPLEKAYLGAVEKGDYAQRQTCPWRYGCVEWNVAMEAEIYFKININCIDPLGRTALLIAIENENLEIIELLLSFNVYLGDALLHAIRKEVVGAVELLLNHKKPSGGMQVPPILLDKQFSDFTPDITPIILAAHTNNYEIIKLLVQKGVSVPQPHEVRCNCVDPSLIALSSEDPFLTAFRLSWELQELSKVENEFKSEYEELSQLCKQFAKDLLDQTRSSRELEMVLNYRDNVENEFKSEYEELSQLCKQFAKDLLDQTRSSRELEMVLNYRDNFVAQPNCQQLLASRWYDEFPGWRRRHWAGKFLTCVFIGLLFPVFALCYLVAPKSRYGLFIRKPFIKFICHTASYLTFLFLLLLASQHVVSTEPDRQGPAPTPVEWMILPWVLGFIWTEIKQMWDGGFQDYVHDWWNLMDFVMNSLYLATISLKIVAYTKLYFYYETKATEGKCKGIRCVEQNNAFSTLFETLQSLFWSIFGLINLYVTNVDADHQFTEFVGATMFGTYNIISLVVLLNMLIAMMNNSYQHIADHADIEWKFARTKLWMSYFEEGGTLPSPFNIVPSPKSAWYLACWTKRQRRAAENLRINHQYQEVLRNLVKRYVAAMIRDAKTEEGLTEENFKWQASRPKGKLNLFSVTAAILKAGRCHGGPPGPRRPSTGCPTVSRRSSSDESSDGGEKATKRKNFPRDIGEFSLFHKRHGSSGAGLRPRGLKSRHPEGTGGSGRGSRTGRRTKGWLERSPEDEEDGEKEIEQEERESFLGGEVVADDYRPLALQMGHVGQEETEPNY
ncbi:hypothetical protein CRUP_021838, partial [Coryphaenoides rupestris]